MAADPRVSVGGYPTIRYGQAALADVAPSVLSALGVPGEGNVLGLAPVQRACLLLVDGLGWQLLRRHADVAPFLSSLPGRALTVGFPSTTATSLASLGTGLPPGQHGLTGYTSYVEEVGVPVNWLAWRPVGSAGDLRDRLVPEATQPRATAFERAAEAGVAVSTCIPREFDGSGLTRAVLRGGRFVGTFTGGDVIGRAADALERGNRSLVYAYVGDLDLVGHVRGPSTDGWLAQLALIDRFAEQLAARIPGGGALWVTGDHGMVRVPEEDRLDFDTVAALHDGVRALAGEPRARHVHVRPGALPDVLAAWRAAVGDRMWLLTRGEAISEGWFGPRVDATARDRIGDLVAVAHGSVAVVRRAAESVLSSLPGQHGALTDDEVLVPLLELRP